MSEQTTISIRKVTRNRLRDCGKKGESWDAVVNKLIDVYLDDVAHQYYEGNI